MGSAVGGDDKRKIWDVAGGGRTVVVFSATGIEVRARGGEVGGITLCHLMDVDGMLARRKILDVESDFDAFGSARKQSCSHILAVGILEFNSNWLGAGVAMSLLGLGRGSQSEE
jgi:hypothetical protein